MVSEATQCQDNLTTHKTYDFPETDYCHEELWKICGTKNTVPGGKGGRCIRLITLPPSCAVVMKSGNPNFLEPSGPLQACNGTAFTKNTVLRKQCSKERCKCAVINLMCHVWRSWGPSATCSVTAFWLGERSLMFQMLTSKTSATAYWHDMTCPRIHTSSVNLLQESQTSNINL
jgi:hypothetical protein